MCPRKSICVGLDVHKNNVWACVAFKNPDVKYDELKFVTKKFNSNHTDLVFSGIEGESAMRVIMYMIETEEPDFYEVLKLIRKSCKIMKYSSEEERKEKEEELRKAIVGAKFSPQQKFKLRSAYEKIDQLNKQIRNYEYMMHQTLEPFNNYLDLLDSIPGISKLAAMQILAEIGTDMDHFENEKQFISWCGLCPQSNESNNKHKTVKIGKGGYYLKPVLIQCALAAVKNHYFKAKYESISRRRGKKRALIAIARKLMVIAYHLFQTGEYFREDYG